MESTTETPVLNIGTPCGSVAPGDHVVCGGNRAVVQRVEALPPGDPARSHAPIVAAMIAVRVQTDRGVRWIGATDARIMGDLRMHWTR